MDIKQQALKKHEEWQGKIEVVSRTPVKNREQLSLAYTPGVAQPCLEIQKDINKSYELTRRHNLVAVITDGSAVLGLGILARRQECLLWKVNVPCSRNLLMLMLSLSA